MKTFSKSVLLPAIVLASSQLLATGAQAQWYSESSVFNVDLSSAQLNSSGRNTTTEFDEDIGLGFAIGYAYDSGLRLEAEYLSTDNDAETVNFNGNLFEGSDARGGIETNSLFFNVSQSFNLESSYSPYVGVGVGYTEVESDISYGAANANITDDDTVFSYQLLAGLDVKFTDNLVGFVEYRFVDAGDVDLNRDGGGPGGRAVTSQSGDIDFDAYGVGLRYQF